MKGHESLALLCLEKNLGYLNPYNYLLQVKFYFECDVSSHPGFQKSEGGGPATDGSVPQPVLRSKGVVAKRDHQKPRVTAPRKCLVAETEFLAGKGNYELDDGFLEVDLCYCN